MPEQITLTDGISPYPSLSTIYLCVASLTILCSLVCNLFIITTVYGWNEVLKPLDWFIMNLSLWDILSLLFATPTIDNVQMNWTISEVFCKASYSVVYISYAVTVLTLCAASIERYYGICKSVVYQKHLNTMKWKWIFPAIWLVSIALFAVYFLVYGKKPIGKAGGVCDETWKSESSGIFFLLVPILLLTVIPLIFMILTLVKVVKKFKDSRTPSSGGSAVLNMRRRQTVKLLVCMVLLHYVCWLPTIVVKLIGAFGSKSPWYWVILAFCDLPHFARTIFYILLYSTMYPVFKRNSRVVCTSCFCCRTSGDTSSPRQ